jgi:hypothetical protein
MADTKEKAERHDESRAEAHVEEDRRKPYEAPKLLKKRSVARATLFSPGGGHRAPGVAMTG